MSGYMLFRYYGNSLSNLVALSDRYMEPGVVPMSKLSSLQQRLTTKQTSKQPELLYTGKINSWLQGGLAILKFKLS